NDYPERPHETFTSQCAAGTAPRSSVSGLLSLASMGSFAMVLAVAFLAESCFTWQRQSSPAISGRLSRWWPSG
ncbi:MAG TPA: hypothetical protein VMV93_08575, partial [Chloroflexota bacterium]|nr:hypothetical protein [Chloroflexota bacterium]